MRLHIEERVEQLKREGLSPEEAERQARIAFGNPTVVEERSREVWQWPTLESIAGRRAFRRSASCAVLPDSPSLPSSRWLSPSAPTPWSLAC